MRKFFGYTLATSVVLLMLPALFAVIAGAATKDEELDNVTKNILVGLGCINSAVIWWVILK